MITKIEAKGIKQILATKHKTVKNNICFFDIKHVYANHYMTELSSI
jgi:hypothetical protein